MTNQRIGSNPIPESHYSIPGTWYGVCLPPKLSISNIRSWKSMDPTSGDIPLLLWCQKVSKPEEGKTENDANVNIHSLEYPKPVLMLQQIKDQGNLSNPRPNHNIDFLAACFPSRSCMCIRCEEAVEEEETIVKSEEAFHAFTAFKTDMQSKLIM